MQERFEGSQAAESDAIKRFEEINITDFPSLLVNSSPSVEPLSFDESCALSKRIKSGVLPDGSLTEDAIEARDTLIFSCQKMIFKLAQRYSSSRDARNDLIQEGFIEAQRAALNYDPDTRETKAKFSTFAYLPIRQGILQVARKSWSLERELQFVDTDGKPDEDDIYDSYVLFTESLPDKDAIFGTKLEENIDLNASHKVFSEAIQSCGLTEKQYAVLMTRFGLGYSQAETGKILGKIFGKDILPTSVDQIEAQAIKKLRKRGVIEKIKGYFR